MSEDSELDAYERQLIKNIEELQRSYQRAAEPYVKELVRVRNLRPSPVIWVTPAQCAAIGEIIPLATPLPHTEGTEG